MTLTYTGVVLIVLFVLEFWKWRCYVFWRHATPHLWEVIIVVFGLPTKFGSVGTIVLLFTKMLMSFPNHVVGAKEIEKCRRGKISP